MGVKKEELSVHHGAQNLGEVDMLLFHGDNPFPNNEIHINHITSDSRGCHLLAVLRIIFVGLKLKLRSTVNQPELMTLHESCLREGKTAVVIFGDEEVHLVAMPSSKLLKFPCFWGYSVPIGVYEVGLGMLNQRRLALVFNLDDTLFAADTVGSLGDKIAALQNHIDRESDTRCLSDLTDKLKQYKEDKSLLEQYTERDSFYDGVNSYQAELEQDLLHETQEPGYSRSVVGKNVVLTHIKIEDRDTSFLVRKLPGWDDFREYLTTKRRFEVHVCTMAKRDYALGMWRLLDPKTNLIESEDRIVCVNEGAKKSLSKVFIENKFLKKMAMVIDVSKDAWVEEDRSHVLVVPPYQSNVYETAYRDPVFYMARKFACSLRAGFYRELDEILSVQISLVCYEDSDAHLTVVPDVSYFSLSGEDRGWFYGNLHYPERRMTRIFQLHDSARPPLEQTFLDTLHPRDPTIYPFEYLSGDFPGDFWFIPNTGLCLSTSGECFRVPDPTCFGGRTPKGYVLGPVPKEVGYVSVGSRRSDHLDLPRVVYPGEYLTGWVLDNESRSCLSYALVFHYSTQRVRGYEDFHLGGGKYINYVHLEDGSFVERYQPTTDDYVP